MPAKKRERERDTKGILRRIGGYMMRHKGLLVLAVIMTLISNSLALVGPMLSGYAIDAIELGKGLVAFNKVFYYAGLMLGLYLLSSAFGYLLQVVMITVSRRVIFSMREDIFNKLAVLPVKFFDANYTGDIISKISYDCDTLNGSLSGDLVQILASIITIVGSFIMMAHLSPLLVLISVLTIPLTVIISGFIAKKTKPLFRTRSKMTGELNGFVEEMVTGLKTIKAYNQERNTVDAQDTVNSAVVDAYYKAEYYSSLAGPGMNFINNLSMALVSVFGALIYMAGGMSIGNISSFVMYSRRFAGPINEIANIYGELQSALAAAERIFRLLDEIPEPEDVENAIELQNVEGDVKIEEVNFGYVAEKPVLHNFNLHAEPGSLTAIVGPTGAGKTTMINMLMRFYDIDSGKITVDGQSVSQLNRLSLRRAYSMVLQDTWLFYGSIFENIAYGKPEASKEEVEAVARAVKLHSYIMRLPEGYDTILTDDGSNISKGQMQLLTIARAMLMDSHMLILDEATSNVDTRTEVQIQLAMRRLMQDKTCFVVAHRLSTVRNADKILVVRNGNVVESGTHDELMTHNGFYRELYYAQFA